MDKCGKGWVPGVWELEAGLWVSEEVGTEIPVSSVSRRKRLEAWTSGFEEEGGWWGGGWGGGPDSWV